MTEGSDRAAPGAIVDLVTLPGAKPGAMGNGAMHHVAWRARDDNRQRSLREALAAAGADVTPVIERHYFRSVYFHEPGGVLFEIATDGPGFSVDEPIEGLGETLRLPPWLERHRAAIERRLVPLVVPRGAPGD